MGIFLDLEGKAHYPWKVMKSTISSKGQITVPVEIRQKLGLRAGTVVLFELQEGAVVMRKGSVGEHPVDRVFGILELERPGDELIDEMRGPRPKEP